jgi:hypothetical protein
MTKMPHALTILGRGRLSISTGVDGEHRSAAQGLPEGIDGAKAIDR